MEGLVQAGSANPLGDRNNPSGLDMVCRFKNQTGRSFGGAHSGSAGGQRHGSRHFCRASVPPHRLQQPFRQRGIRGNSDDEISESGPNHGARHKHGLRTRGRSGINGKIRSSQTITEGCYRPHRISPPPAQGIWRRPKIRIGCLRFHGGNPSEGSAANAPETGIPMFPPLTPDTVPLLRKSSRPPCSLHGGEGKQLVPGQDQCIRFGKTSQFRQFGITGECT